MSEFDVQRRSNLHGLHWTEQARRDRWADQIQRIRIGDRDETANEEHETAAERQADHTEELRYSECDPVEKAKLDRVLSWETC